MRGKVFMRVIDSDGEGITPAYAGKSSDVFQKIPLYKDHPRLCGEKCVSYEYGFKIRGSPPPMRGKVILNHLEPLSRRITPAYAGKRFPEKSR